AQHQPEKLAAMEGLYDGSEGAGLVAFGILNPGKKVGDNIDDFIIKIEIPKLLSLLGYRSLDAFVPGANDLVYGNDKYSIMSASEKMEKGKVALDALAAYKEAYAQGDATQMEESLTLFKENYYYMGYGYLHNPESILPNIPFIFYSFHIMVILGFAFVAIAALFLYLAVKNRLEKQKWLLWLGIWSFPLAMIASMAGWIVAEVGRQPWTIQGFLPTMVSTSNISSSAVILTFWMFLILLLTLVAAEARIMYLAIRKGPDNKIDEKKEGGSHA
ncbi:MAG TPA: cytochrome ubiquinol oxidase subunit I, partial [Bacteroidetes bacterium]|nr:cytochrome ubiquinol oxidase subunit I [Bacteroidota bacterium]